MKRFLKSIHFELARSAKTLSLIGLVGTSLLLSVHAMPPPSAFGVWDRGSSFDPKEYPFLKGLAFNPAWAEVEKQPGIFDWSALDQAMENAVKRNQFLYLSVNVGPDAPQWIYTRASLAWRRATRCTTVGRFIPSIVRRNTNRYCND